MKRTRLSLVGSALALALAFTLPGCGGAVLDDPDDDHAGLDASDEGPLSAWDEGSFSSASTCKKDLPMLVSGLHPDASDALRCIGVAASRISQTIGSAPASAGYHAKDGVAEGHPYTAAVDLRVRDLSEAKIRSLLNQLGNVGYAGWYRKPGADGWPASEAPHIHAVWAGSKMKEALRGQVRDWLAGKNGLTSHTTYKFWQPTAAMKTLVRDRFNKAN